MEKVKTNSSVKQITTVVTLSLLIALEIVLSRFLSFSVWNQKIGLSFICVVLAAALYGPVGGAVVGGLADFIGAILFPIGAYFPGFTFTRILVGIVFGIFLSGKLYSKANKIVCVVFSVLITQIVGSLLLDTLWISILYGTPFKELMITRLVQCAIMIPLQIVLIPFVLRLSLQLRKFLKK